MFFKNAQVYRLPENWNHQISADELDAQLCTKAFRPCGALDAESRGWVTPVAHQSFQHLHAVAGHWLICLQTATKILPASVVKDEAAARAEKISEELGYKPGRKQMKEIKESVLAELLPNAFVRRRKTFAWIDPVGGWLAIDASSQRAAEDVLEVLRQTLDTLPLTLLRTERSPTSAMADWLSANEAPAGFTIDQDCRLRSVAEDEAEVTYTRGLNEEQIREHLTAGKLPTKLAMTFDDRISFTLTEKSEIKRIDFLDLVTDELHNQQPDDAAALFDAGFALMTGELSRLIPALVTAMGGELKPSTEGIA